MFEALKKYATFSGRASRKEYWLFQLLLMVVGFIFCMGFIATMVHDGNMQNMQTDFIAIDITLVGVFSVVLIALFIPAFAVTVRRFHDQDLSGWFALLVFVPGIGNIILLIFMLLPGTVGDNRFGPDPLKR